MQRRTVLSSLVVIGAVAALMTATSMAVFTDQVVSEANTVSAGTLFLSVDGDCGPPDRTAGGGGTGGGDGCETDTAALNVTNMRPGDTASHQFTIVNEGSLPGALSVDAEVTGDCFDATVDGPLLATLTASGEPGDETTATVDVMLPITADNACQGESATVTVTFDLEQLP